MTKFIDEEIAPNVVKYFEMWRSADKHLKETFGAEYDRLVGCLMLEVGIGGEVSGNWERIGMVKHVDNNYPCLVLD